MSDKVLAEEMGASMQKIGDEYLVEIKSENKQLVEDACKVVLDEVQEKSPVKTGKYKRGWKLDVSDSSGSVIGTVHNKAKPGLTHLLEQGHGGKHKAPAFPHIEPAYKAGAKYIEDHTK